MGSGDSLCRPNQIALALPTDFFTLLLFGSSDQLLFARLDPS